MSILKSTNSGIYSVKADKGLLLTWLKEIGYDIIGSYYVATNEKYRFLPHINLEDMYVISKNQWHFYINIIAINGDQHYCFSTRYIINTYSDFLTFKNDINAYIDKYVNS